MKYLLITILLISCSKQMQNKNTGCMQVNDSKDTVTYKNSVIVSYHAKQLSIITQNGEFACAFHLDELQDCENVIYQGVCEWKGKIYQVEINLTVRTVVGSYNDKTRMAAAYILGIKPFDISGTLEPTKIEL